jgi:hypothetical protein
MQNRRRVDATKQLRGGMESAVADLAWIVEDASEMATVRATRCRSGGRADGVSFGEIRAAVVEEQRDDACSILRRAVSILSSSAMSKPRSNDVPEQPEGPALRLWRGATAEQHKALRSRVAPGGELVQQSALADARIGHHL